MLRVVLRVVPLGLLLALSSGMYCYCARALAILSLALVASLLESCLELPIQPPVQQIVAELPALANEDQWFAHLGQEVRLAGPLTLVELSQGKASPELLLAWQGRPVAGDDTTDHWVPIRWHGWGTAEQTSSAAPLPRLGSTVEQLHGKIVGSRNALYLQLAAEPQWQRAARPAAPIREPEQLLVAALNVQNYFLTLNERGAVTVAGRERQTQRLAATLVALQADIWALVELESGGVALETLRRATNELLGEESYRAIVLKSCPGSDLIESGLLYRPDRVRPWGKASWNLDPALRRCPLLQSFEVGAQRMTLGVVHWKSRRCAAGASSNRNAEGACGAAERLGEAQALTRWIDEVVTEQPSTEVLLLGDFNSHRADLALQHLRAAGLVELLRQPVAAPRAPLYSYAYRGEVSLLDGFWATSGLVQRQTAAGIWHSNADEPRRFADKRLQEQQKLEEQGSQKLISFEVLGPWRSSDHDPVWAAFRR